MRVFTQVRGLGTAGLSVEGDPVHTPKDVRQVHGLDGDSVLLQGEFVVAHRLERGRASPDGSDREPPHAPDGPAHAIEVVDVRRECPTARMDGVRLQCGEADVVLAEDIHDGELAAERIPPVCGIHLVQLVRIGMHEYGHVGLAKRYRGPRFVAEVGQGNDDPVVAAMVVM